jgi:hypothetical protein
VTPPPPGGAPKPPTITETSAHGIATITVDGGPGDAGKVVELFYRSGLSHKIISIGHGVLDAHGHIVFTVHFGKGQKAKVYARITGVTLPYTPDDAFTEL